MRRLALCLVGLWCASPAWAQFNAYYSGTQNDGGKDVAMTAQFSVEKGRAAVVMKSSRAFRMLFLEKDQVLRVVDDTGKSYVDLGPQTLAAMGGDVEGEMAKAQEEMAKLPPEQRQQMEQMMQGALASVKKPEPDRYVWSQEKQTIKGYECTRVDIMQGDVKKAEYWGSTSPDFKLSADEHATMLEMQKYLRDYTLQAVGGPAGPGDGPRAFQWDTGADGYPLISRCFNGEKMVLDLHLDSVDRKALASDLFKLPSGYKKQDLGGMAPKSGKQHGH